MKRKIRCCNIIWPSRATINHNSILNNNKQVIWATIYWSELPIHVWMERPCRQHIAFTWYKHTYIHITPHVNRAKRFIFAVVRVYRSLLHVSFSKKRKKYMHTTKGSCLTLKSFITNCTSTYRWNEYFISFFSFFCSTYNSYNYLQMICILRNYFHVSCNLKKYVCSFSAWFIMD